VNSLLSCFLGDSSLQDRREKATEKQIRDFLLKNAEVHLHHCRDEISERHRHRYEFNNKYLDQLKKAVDMQKILGGKLGTVIVKLGFISDEELTRFLAKQENLPIVDLDKIVIPANRPPRKPSQRGMVAIWSFSSCIRSGVTRGAKRSNRPCICGEYSMPGRSSVTPNVASATAGGRSHAARNQRLSRKEIPSGSLTGSR
jgi:hypothetical protein